MPCCERRCGAQTEEERARADTVRADPQPREIAPDGIEPPVSHLHGAHPEEDASFVAFDAVEARAPGARDADEVRYGEEPRKQHEADRTSEVDHLASFSSRGS